MRRFLNLLSFAVVLGGCASTGGNLSSGSRSVIERGDIEDNPASNAWDLVQSVRPEWLRVREEVGIGRTNDIVVYLDNARLGGREALRSVPVASVQYLRRFDPVAANLRWGAGHAYGAILISTTSDVR
jgi:hypothetical protein